MNKLQWIESHVLEINPADQMLTIRFAYNGDTDVIGFGKSLTSVDDEPGHYSMCEPRIWCGLVRVGAQVLKLWDQKLEGRDLPTAPVNVGLTEQMGDREMRRLLKERRCMDIRQTETGSRQLTLALTFRPFDQRVLFCGQELIAADGSQPMLMLAHALEIWATEVERFKADCRAHPVQQNVA
jgi:hypothetical protein